MESATIERLTYKVIKKKHLLFVHAVPYAIKSTIYSYSPYEDAPPSHVLSRMHLQ